MLYLYLSGSELFRCSICAPICILNFFNFSGRRIIFFFFLFTIYTSLSPIYSVFNAPIIVIKKK